MNRIVKCFGVAILVAAAFSAPLSAQEIERGGGNEPPTVNAQPVPQPPPPPMGVITATVQTAGGMPVSWEMFNVSVMAFATPKRGGYTFWVAGTSCRNEFDPNQQESFCADSAGRMFALLPVSTFADYNMTVEVWANGYLVKRLQVPELRNGVADLGVIKMEKSPVRLRAVARSSYGGRVAFSVFIEKEGPGPVAVDLQTHVSGPGAGEPYGDAMVLPVRVRGVPSSASRIIVTDFSTEVEYEVQLPAYVLVGRDVSIWSQAVSSDDAFTTLARDYTFTYR